MRIADKNWLEEDFEQRRYVTIYEDSAGPPKPPAKFFEELVDGAGELLPFAMIFAPAVALGSLVVAAVGAAAESAQEPLEVLAVSDKLARSADFGMREPQPGIVYAANPRHPVMYRSVATFQEELFLHKIAELERLLIALGAKEYEIRYAHSAKRTGGAKLGVPAIGEAKLSAEGSELTERRWSGSTDGHAPEVPKDLIWYDGEPEWQALVASRKKRRRKKFAFLLRQEEDFGVNASLSEKITALGLQAGGEFKNVTKTEFSVSGTF